MSSLPEMPASMSVLVDRVPQDVFMSYALLNQLIPLVPNIDEIGETLLNGEVRGKMLYTLLVPRDAKNKPSDPDFSVDEHAISVDDVMALIDWAQGHLIGFFVRGGAALKSRVEAAQAVLYPSTPSSAGTGA